jgi:type 2 lantibiotic biosynthesis protein LanM
MSMLADQSAEGSADSALKPLLRWAEPLFAAARERSLRRWENAARRHPERFDSERLHASIEAAFATPALNWSCRTLLLELAIARHLHSLLGETPQARFQYFLDEIDSANGRRVLDERYPLLGADIAAQADQTERFLDRLLARITQDYERVSTLFPDQGEPARLHTFTTGQGDRHDHGGSVVKLVFEGGLALYKPRSLAMDAAYAQFLDQLAEHGIEPTQQAAVALDCGDYGYVSWVEHRPLHDEAAAARYYRRYGGLVAIAYVLNGSDLHLENLIACGEYPVVIDLETLLQPWVSRYAADDRRDIPYAPSVLFSSLLPGLSSDADAWDISGLASAEHRYTTRLAAAAGTDELRLAPTDAVTQARANVPYLADGQRITSHGYAALLVDGFETTYDGLLRLKPRLRGSRGLLAPFAQTHTRTVLRSTPIYARLLNALSHPQYLRSAAERDAVLARLELGSRHWPFLARTHDAERAALLRGDVPRFTACVNSLDIHDGDGRVVKNLCERSGWDEVQRRLRILSPRDLRRQSHALAQALECDRLSSTLDAGAGFDTEAILRVSSAYRGGSFLETAVAIGDELLALSFRRGGGLALFHPEYGNREQAAIGPMGISLYEGMPGLILLFAELGLQTGHARFTRAADAALASCRRFLREDPQAFHSIGAYDGLGGWIYVLLTLGARLRRDELIDEAASWVAPLVERIGADRHLDLIGGAAGCLLVLLELHRHRPDDAVLAAASACATRLLETAQHGSDGIHWLSPASPDGGLTGFAHGTAGIGAALLRYADRTQHAPSRAAAAQALEYERAAFAARGRRWYDRDAKSANLAADAPETCCWCRGASGVGLARLLWPQSARDDAWHDDLMHCIETTRKQGMHSGACLCHGALGNLELLLQYATQEGDASVLSECRDTAKELLEQARSGWLLGGGSAAQQPLGLMIGLSGVAYACLRLADPAGVPAVLSLAVGAAPAA